MARCSDYVIAPVDRPADLRAVLEHSLGIVCVVTKVRQLLLLHSTRIHLDEVEGLGSFVELETVMEGRSEDDAHRELRSIANGLEIEEGALIAVPYAELLGSLA